MNVLVTGAAGFIGHALSHKLLSQGHTVVGVDNMNDYYSVALKEARLATLTANPHFSIHTIDIANADALQNVFATNNITHVVNLAAQAGVRYSLINPQSYVQSNLVGFGNLLECCRHNKIEHFVYASSSSVYGMNKQLPFSVNDSVDHPVSLYAATKKSNELMAHSYSHLFRLPTTGLRFFTVYGPWGRPDMALYIFTKAMLAGEAIPVFNDGKMLRDFTYIDDIVEGVARIIPVPAKPCPQADEPNPSPACSTAPYTVYNIGNNNAIELKEFIAGLEDALGIKAKLNLMPMQNGDVPATYADIDSLQANFDFAPATPLHTGLKNWVAWYKEYNKL